MLWLQASMSRITCCCSLYAPSSSWDTLCSHELCHMSPFCGFGISCSLRQDRPLLRVSPLGDAFLTAPFQNQLGSIGYFFLWMLTTLATLYFHFLFTCLSFPLNYECFKCWTKRSLFWEKWRRKAGQPTWKSDIHLIWMSSTNPCGNILVVP